MDMTIIRVGMIRTNCYIISGEGEKKCVVIDPGFEADKLSEEIEKKYEGVDGILLTHGHFDHMTEAVKLKDHFHTSIYACDVERDLLMNPEKNCTISGIRQAHILDCDQYLKDQENIELAGITFRVIHTPGHTKGSCCYYAEQENKLFSGDTLFLQSVGRTDLPTGSERDILQSVEKLMLLPEDVQVYPGHGESTTIGYEKKYNPYA